MSDYVDIVKQAINDLYDDQVKDLTVELMRPDPKFGDYSTNIAMRLAGVLRQSPHVIAEEIKAKLDERGVFSAVDIAGPGFINLTVSAKALSNQLEAGFHSDLPYGENNDGQGKTVVLDFPSNNTAKPLSVGHLRPANQGWAARNLMRATGWKTISDNHLGDYGTPFGIWVEGFRRFSNREKLNERGVYELGDIYVKARALMKEEEERGETEFADKAQDWLLRLDKGDPEAKAYSQRFNEISIKHTNEVLARLGIKTDYALGESFYVKDAVKAVHKLVDDGIAEQNDDGSIIVRLDDYGIKTPILILKSNGAPLYATTDLGTLIYRRDHFHADRVIYVVAEEQKFYFTQLFAMAKKIGFQMELIHMWFGLIDQINEDGTRSKMSSRKGVVLLEDLLDEAEKRARENAKSKDISDDDIRKIAVGAVKFADFANDRYTGMLFDWNTMFSLTGYSGPYIQYAAVRVNKILRDNAEHLDDEIDAAYDYEAEKSVILKLLDYPETVRAAANDLQPHTIARYVYELAKEMNRYYEKTPVATSEVPAGVRAARLDMLKRVSYVFEHALCIMGIEIPERM